MKFTFTTFSFLGYVSLSLILTSFISNTIVESGSCIHLNSCSGHGICDLENSRCNCFTGWGAPEDKALYRAPDCSLRSCPADRAWVDVPTSAITAHAVAECSNQGLCDRTTGRCRCFAGYEGEACQRSACPGSPPCSSHGKCSTLRQMAEEVNAQPIGPPQTYGGDSESSTWDEDKIQGCVCDSGWAVGYGSGQRQVPEYWGPDCSLRHCPGNDDPRTYDLNEADCEYYDDNGARWLGIIGSDDKKYKSIASLPNGVTVKTPASCTPGYDCGAAGNLCFVECSNRGLCDYNTGICSCFKGYFGVDCGLKVT